MHSQEIVVQILCLMIFSVIIVYLFILSWDISVSRDSSRVHVNGTLNCIYLKLQKPLKVDRSAWTLLMLQAFFIFCVVLPGL